MLKIREVIELNEYVRTENGYISKNTTSIPWILKDMTINNSPVVKHSKQLIDLIEEGDILKYKLKNLDSEYITVVKKYYDARINKYCLLINGYRLEQVEMLEILTYDQFEQNCYRVEE